MQSRAADPYAVLGVPRTASRRAMADAYRRLAKRYHPDVDRNPGAADRMRCINAAWRELSKPAADAGGRGWSGASVPWTSARPRAHRAATRPSGSWAAWTDRPGTEQLQRWKSVQAPLPPKSRRPPPACGVRFQDTGLAAVLVAVVMVLLLFAAAYAGSLSSPPPLS